MASIRLRFFPYQKLRKQSPAPDAGRGEEGTAAGGPQRPAQAARRGWPRRRWRPRVRILPLRKLPWSRTGLVRASLGSVMRRLKEANYLFVQVRPAPPGTRLEKTSPAAHGRGRAALPPPASWYCLPGVA